MCTMRPTSGMGVYLGTGEEREGCISRYGGGRGGVYISVRGRKGRGGYSQVPVLVITVQCTSCTVNLIILVLYI